MTFIYIASLKLKKFDLETDCASQTRIPVFNEATRDFPIIDRGFRHLHHMNSHD